MKKSLDLCGQNFVGDLDRGGVLIFHSDFIMSLKIHIWFLLLNSLPIAIDSLPPLDYLGILGYDAAIDIILVVLEFSLILKICRVGLM